VEWARITCPRVVTLDHQESRRSVTILGKAAKRKKKPILNAMARIAVLGTHSNIFNPAPTAEKNPHRQKRKQGKKSPLPWGLLEKLTQQIAKLDGLLLKL
jgi:hypothetical protein